MPVEIEGIYSKFYGESQPTLEIDPRLAPNLLKSANNTIHVLLTILREQHKNSDEYLRASFDALKADWDIKVEALEGLITPPPTFTAHIDGVEIGKPWRIPDDPWQSDIIRPTDD